MKHSYYTTKDPRSRDGQLGISDNGHFRFVRASEFRERPLTPELEVDRAKQSIRRLFTLYGGRSQTHSVVWILSALDDRDLKLRDSLVATTRLISEGELEYRLPSSGSWMTGSTGEHHFKGVCSGEERVE